MKITKHITISFTLDEVKEKLLEYQKDIMAEILAERLNVSFSNSNQADAIVTGFELIEWSMLMLKGTHTKEFTAIENGRWIHTPNVFGGYITLLTAYPHIFMDTQELLNFNAEDFTVELDFLKLNSAEILENI